MISKCMLKLYKDYNFIEHYEICASIHNKEKIWINNQDGEGGEFNTKAFYECIDKFFKDNY